MAYHHTQGQSSVLMAGGHGTAATSGSCLCHKNAGWVENNTGYQQEGGVCNLMQFMLVYLEEEEKNSSAAGG